MHARLLAILALLLAGCADQGAPGSIATGAATTTTTAVAATTTTAPAGDGGSPADWAEGWYWFDPKQCEAPPWGDAERDAPSQQAAVLRHYPVLDDAAWREVRDAVMAVCGAPGTARMYGHLRAGESNATLLSDGWSPSLVPPSGPGNGVVYHLLVPPCEPRHWDSSGVSTAEGVREHYAARGLAIANVEVQPVTATPNTCEAYYTEDLRAELVEGDSAPLLEADGWERA